MKNLVTVLLMVLFVSSVASAQLLPRLSVKAGFDLPGNLRTTLDDNDTDTDVKNGFNVGAEITANLLIVELGVGASYMVDRELDIEDFTGKFGMTPLYAIAKVNIIPLPLVKPQIIAHAGLNIFNPDDDFKASYTPSILANTVEVEGQNGYYLGIGVGVQVTKLSAELMYKFNSGGIKYSAAGEEIELDLLYSYVGLSVAYSF